MTSPKRLARIAGVLYLLVAVLSGFAFGYVVSMVYVPGNAAASAANVAANPELVRAGVVADLVQATLWVLLAIALYVLLKHVHQTAAGAMVVLVAVGAAIVCLNEVFQFETVRVAGSSALVLLLLDLHHYGFLAAQIFFGLWLVPLGWLAIKSAMFPKLLGVALIVGGTCYLVGTVAVFLIPDFGEKINTIITIPSAVAEISMVAYLLVFGAKAAGSKKQILAAA